MTDGMYRQSSILMAAIFMALAFSISSNLTFLLDSYDFLGVMSSIDQSIMWVSCDHDHINARSAGWFE